LNGEGKRKDWDKNLINKFKYAEEKIQE
jgi:hypothetical protein